MLDVDTQLLERYGGAVPRYTSYPTAPHFHDGIDGGVYADWLGKITDDSSLSLYFHVPFCAKMCWYCGCHTKVVSQYDPVARYSGTLSQEIDLVAGALSAQPPVKHIHWGGGTPTILSKDDFAQLMERIGRCFNLAPDAEIAIEIDPRTIDQAKAEALCRAGVNRVSLGIQDFNEEIQEAINRVQSIEQTERVVDWLRGSGIEAVNFDLMYGLPGQTVADVERTVDLCMAMKPERLSIFGYAHVPWMKTHQKMIHEDELPDGPERMRQAIATSDRLVEHGYERIGLDHFALPDDSMSEALHTGHLQRNFQGYTTDAAPVLLGLGASAIGNLPQGYAQNSPSFREYRRRIEAGELPTVRGVELDGEDRLRRDLIERLMCDLEVDLEEVNGRHGTAAAFARERTELQDMAADGLVELEGPLIRVTETGRSFVRTVCAVFDTYLASGRGRHSRAV